jgi:uncharacterized protein (TIGR02453 family)
VNGHRLIGQRVGGDHQRTLPGMAAVAGRAERFSGFSDEAIQFFLELQAEQSRTWFKAHQADFARLCRRPLELLVEGLRERLVDVYPGIADTEPHFFRIQRDTRFSKDKAPYKTYIAADMPIRPPRGDEEDEHNVPGVYLSFGLDGEFVGIGAWHMSPETLTRFRQAVDSAVHGPRIQALVDGLLTQGCQIESMEKLKRVPPPFTQDHPRGELLKLKGLAIGARPEDNISSSPIFLDWAETRLRAAAPLVHLLDNVLVGA